jgi:rubrerythrin
MAEFFNAADVLGAAVEMERRGKAAYRVLARSAGDDQLKMFFENLAVEEARHEEVFSAMAGRAGMVELPAWSTEAEYKDYLAALLDSHALFATGQSEALFSGAVSLEEAVQAAMKLEKDSMLFFQEMLQLVPGSEHGQIQKCLEEERGLLRRLAALLKN